MAITQRREYVGGAGTTGLNGSINATDTSINIQDETNWPTGGVNGPFTVVIDFGLSNQESVLIDSRSGTTLTVASGGRGNDDTSAASHANNAEIFHGATAEDFDDANRHIHDATHDDHTQYMQTDGTRHDLTARHEVGTSIAAATPGTITPDDTAAEGASTSAARADHTHATSTGTPADVGVSASEGVSGSFPRLDHVHPIGTDAINDEDQFASNVEPPLKASSAPTTETNRFWWNTTDHELRRWDGSNWVTTRRIARLTASEEVPNSTLHPVDNWSLDGDYQAGFVSLTGTPNPITLEGGVYWVNVLCNVDAGTGVAGLILDGTNGWGERRQWAPNTALFGTGMSLTRFRAASSGTDLNITLFQNSGGTVSSTIEISIEKVE